MNKQKNPAVTSRIKSFSKAGHSARQTLNLIIHLWFIKLKQSQAHQATQVNVKLETLNLKHPTLLCALRRV